MDNLVFRLLDLSIHFDQCGMPNIAKTLTEAVKEIENARLVRGTTDQSTEPGRNEEL